MVLMVFTQNSLLPSYPVWQWPCTIFRGPIRIQVVREGGLKTNQVMHQWVDVEGPGEISKCKLDGGQSYSLQVDSAWISYSG